MSSIDLRPQTVDVAAYAGDTISFQVNVSDPTLIEGAAWSAQVRAKRASEEVAAAFVVTPNGSSATLTLDATTTGTLGAFKGAWDVQVDQGGVVTTLVQGAFTLDQDVTRA